MWYTRASWYSGCAEQAGTGWLMHGDIGPSWLKGGPEIGLLVLGGAQRIAWNGQVWRWNECIHRSSRLCLFTIVHSSTASCEYSPLNEYRRVPRLGRPCDPHPPPPPSVPRSSAEHPERSTEPRLRRRSPLWSGAERTLTMQCTGRPVYDRLLIVYCPPFRNVLRRGTDARPRLEAGP